MKTASIVAGRTPRCAAWVTNLLAHGAQDRGLLLADRVAEGVRLGAREAAQGDGGGHDVFLVDEDPVRLLEVGLEQRVEVGHRLLAVLAADVGGDVVHRPRPVERHHRREVEDRGRLQVADVAPHPRRLQLEDPGRLARPQQLEGPGIVQGDRLEVDRDAPDGPDEIDRLAQDREVRQAEEVELEEPQGLDGVHLVLGHQGVGVGGLLERHELDEGLAADHDAGGVGAGVPGDALQLLGQADEPRDRGIRLGHLAQLGRDLEGLLELDPELVRDGLGDPVDLAVAEAQHPADVADGGPGEHRAEGDDLGDAVGAVLAGDVGDDLVAPAVLEVDVDVGHRHAVGVEEALEGQLVADRVDRGDPEGVGHDRARGAAAAGRGDALPSRAKAMKSATIRK